MFGFSFAKLAQISTGKNSWLGGLIPPLGTIVSLLLISAVIASGAWAWAGFWGGALAQAGTFFPFLQNAVIGVFGTTLLNFWFNREINTFILNTRQVRKPFVYAQKKNPTHLWHLVNHLRQELNVHFRQKYGNRHTDLPMPRLCTYTGDEFKIAVSEGRNPGKAGFFFTSGAFLYAKSNMSQRELAALIQKELVKIYLRRGVARTIVGMGVDLANTLSNLNSGNWFFKALSFITIPLQFILLIARALNRSYEYEAARIVAECGRGVDLVRGYDSKVCSTLETLPTAAELKEDFNRNKRAPYNGPLKTVLRPITDFVDNNEYVGEDNTGDRLNSLADITVREGGYYVNELWSNDPRSTNIKNYLRPLVKARIDGQEVNLDTVTTAQMERFQKQQMRINRRLYNQIPRQERYKVIGPDGSGYIRPIKPVVRYDDAFEPIRDAHVHPLRARVRARVRPVREEVVEQPRARRRNRA